MTWEGVTFGVLVAGLVVACVLESRWPLCPAGGSRGRRWLTHAVLYLGNGLLVRLLVPGGLMAVAVWGEQYGWLGLRQLPGDAWLQVPLGVLLLDLGGYGFHRLAHRVQWLWRLHRVHHTDTAVDFSTEFRHHPGETLIVLGWFGGLVVFAGVPLVAVGVWSVLQLPVSLISHCNGLLPDSLDRRLRKLIVTPAMHRIHHSAWRPETDSNYGILLSVWDRWFRSYKVAPSGGYRAMTLGLERFRGPQDSELHELLLNPFR